MGRQPPPQTGVWLTLGDAGNIQGHRKQMWPSFLESQLNDVECKHLHDFFKGKIRYFKELSGMPYSSHASSWAGAVNSALPEGSGLKEEPRPEPAPTPHPHLNSLPAASSPPSEPSLQAQWARPIFPEETPSQQPALACGVKFSFFNLAQDPLTADSQQPCKPLISTAPYPPCSLHTCDSSSSSCLPNATPPLPISSRLPFPGCAPTRLSSEISNKVPSCVMLFLLPPTPLHGAQNAEQGLRAKYCQSSTTSVNCLLNYYLTGCLSC